MALSSDLHPVQASVVVAPGVRTGLAPRRHSPTLVPDDFDLDTWRRAAAWAMSEPPALAVEAFPTGTAVTPVHMRVAELLVAHQHQQERMAALERELRRARWGLGAAALMAAGSGLLAGAALVGALVL